MQVRSAVIPAAGMGTRFLPASKAVPKELLPIGDTPTLQLVIDEALGAGIDHIVVVSSRNKPADRGVLRAVAGAPRRRSRRAARRRSPSGCAASASDWRATIVYQDEPRGLGHAVGCAAEAVGDEPFAVLLPDELMGDSSLLAHMNGVCASTGGSVVALKEVPHEEVGRYGVIDPTGPVDADGVVPIRDLVEKPPVDEAPSDLIIIGRYVLTPDVFDEIAAGRVGALGEIQLTDALRAQAAPLAVPRRRQPDRPLRHRHAARLPHRGDRARPARPELRRRAARRSSTSCRRRHGLSRLRRGGGSGRAGRRRRRTRRRRTRARRRPPTSVRRQRRSPSRS